MARFGPQTRRRLGGRQPLWGIGVTSRMSVTRRPVVWNARSADSRPAPGPLTKIATVLRPCSCALRAASSAASCAANGVLLREPLKPREPALDHAMTFPERSVIETIVLLKVDWTCAMPVPTFFLTFFLVDLPGLAAGGAALGVAGLDIVVSLVLGKAQRAGAGPAPPPPGRVAPLRGPLRVRAFVCVR